MPSSDAQHDSSVDPDLLSTTERQVLDLLAQGHTAKSIASLTGASVGSVNERLRAARRKTGVGSSRELARRLQPQEIRDEKTGLAAGPRAAAASTSTIKRGSFLVRALPVTILTAAVVAAMLIWAQANSAAPTLDPERVLADSGEPLPDVLPPAGADSRRFAALVRSEGRDPAWAPRMEAGIWAAYAAAGPRIEEAKPTTVRCTTTICEIVASFVPAPSGSPTNFEAVVAERIALTEAIQGLGLKHETTGYGPSKSNPKLVAIVAYYSRVTGGRRD